MLSLIALAHVAVIIIGWRAAAAIGAPSWFVESLRAGTLLAPVTVACISCALMYAAVGVLSLASLIKLELPFRTGVVWAFGLALLIRALALPAIAVLVPRARIGIGWFEVATAIAAGLLGACFIASVPRKRSGRGGSSAVSTS